MHATLSKETYSDNREAFRRRANTLISSTLLKANEITARFVGKAGKQKHQTKICQEEPKKRKSIGAQMLIKPFISPIDSLKYTDCSASRSPDHKYNNLKWSMNLMSKDMITYQLANNPITG